VHAATEVDRFVHEPFDFKVVYERAPRLLLGGVKVPVVPIDELLAMKRAANRPQDTADVAALERLSHER
jgi:predicted nucleotidyltransferase